MSLAGNVAASSGDEQENFGDISIDPPPLPEDSFDGMGDPPHSDWITDVPMYLMINVAVGASWMENEAMPDENSQLPVDALLVDYIKVYQKID